MTAGGWTWRARTRSVRAELEASQVAGRTDAYSEGEVADLPDPVRRYFRNVLRNGQPMIHPNGTVAERMTAEPYSMPCASCR